MMKQIFIVRNVNSYPGLPRKSDIRIVRDAAGQSRRHDYVIPDSEVLCNTR